MNVHRTPELDGLRGIAALIVLFCHTRVPAVGGGHLGVDVFFVLSGFLITSILSAELGRSGRIDLKRFYLARMLRLYPALVLFLAGYLTVAPLRWPDHDHLFDAGLAATYLSNYSYAYWGQPQYLLHTWSLAVEFQYYLIWPVFVLAMFQYLGRRERIALLLGLYALFTGWRLVRGMSAPYEALYGLDLRMTGLILGGAIAELGFVGRRSLGSAAAFTIVLWIVLGRSVGYYGDSMAITVIELAVAGLIVSAKTDGLVNRTLSSAPLVFIGTISYAIYLWHGLFAAAIVGIPWYVELPITLFGSIALATASWFMLEKPLMEMRHRMSEKNRKISGSPVARSENPTQDAFFPLALEQQHRTDPPGAKPPR